MAKFLDVNNRTEDHHRLYKDTFRIELGLRAIAIMYDEHSNDKNSYINILKHKENVEYRLFSATYQYLVFLRELSNAEFYLQEIYKKEDLINHSFLFSNPYFDRVEQEISSIFDNIIFQISSMFDYLSHIISYILFKNKSKSNYWMKLAKMSRGNNNELQGLDIKTVIDIVDRWFVGRLYDYRSRLLHYNRDKHQFDGLMNTKNLRFRIKIIPSDLAIKYFQVVNEDALEDEKVTLTYLSSWLIKKSFQEIGYILDALEIEIKKVSCYQDNLSQALFDPNKLDFVAFNSDTRRVDPLSELLWKNFKSYYK